MVVALSFTVALDEDTLIIDLMSVSSPNNEWIWDTGSGTHLCHDKSLFSQLSMGKPYQMNAYSGTINVEGVGTVKFTHLINNVTQKIVLNNVGFAPTGKRNLISGSRAMEAGCTWSDKQDEILVRNKVNKPILKFTRHKGLFKLSATGYSSDSNDVKSTSINGNRVNVIENKSIGDLELWHRRMMHTNIDSMVNMSKGDIARGLPKLIKKEMNCITCIKAKQTKHYGKAKTKITLSEVLDLVHTDVWGPTKYESKGGAKYYVSFVDDYSRWIKTYVMKSKSQVIDCFKDYIGYMKRLTGAKIKRLRSDNETEYCNDKLKQICKTHNIKHEVTNIYSPHMNGVAKRFNRSAIETLRATIVDDNMDRI
uniref:Integrase catalytic domain-containing protein n=1 Tax=Strigamia maritima TaxID=126957 RepID=T1IKU9_STRMM